MTMSLIDKIKESRFLRTAIAVLGVQIQTAIMEIRLAFLNGLAANTVNASQMKGNTGHAQT